MEVRLASPKHLVPRRLPCPAWLTPEFTGGCFNLHVLTSDFFSSEAPTISTLTCSLNIWLRSVLVPWSPLLLSLTGVRTGNMRLKEEQRRDLGTAMFLHISLSLSWRHCSYHHWTNVSIKTQMPFYVYILIPQLSISFFCLFFIYQVFVSLET